MSEVLQPGKKVKDFKVTLTDESSKKLSELMGKQGMVLYFYPKDSTPGCTTEACDFRDNLARLKRLGYQVIGVSPDSSASHQKFTDKQDLNFPLIADTENEISSALGVYGEKKMYGKTYMGILRTTFIVDPKLKVKKVYEKVKVKGHVDQIIADLKQ